MNSETAPSVTQLDSQYIKRKPTVVPPLLAWTTIALVIVGLWFLVAGQMQNRGVAPRAVDSSNLRQVGQASLIYASDNKDQFPQVDDIHAFATALAKGGGLNDATIWLSQTRSGSSEYSKLSTVLAADHQSIEPAFAAVRPSFAAVVRGLNVNLSATTPVAWTRGLQPDGTWSKDSPYGGDGGHVVFLGGNVQWFRNTKDAFIDREGRPATDIRAALPADAVVANN